MAKMWLIQDSKPDLSNADHMNECGGKELQEITKPIPSPGRCCQQRKILGFPLM